MSHPLLPFFTCFSEMFQNWTQVMTHKELLVLRPKNNLHLHFERGDSQHENIPINKPLKLYNRAFEIFAAK